MSLRSIVITTVDRNGSTMKITEHAVDRFIERWAVRLGLATEDEIYAYRTRPIPNARNVFTFFMLRLREKVPTAVFVEDEVGTRQQIWCTTDGILLVIEGDTVKTVLPPGTTPPSYRPQR